MKKLILVTLALLASNAFALNPNRTYFSGGDKLKIVGYQTITKGGFESKQAAVDYQIALMNDMQSGDMSKTASRALRSAMVLWDSGDNCQTTFGVNLKKVERVIERHDAFEVLKISVGSYFTGQGQEVFSSNARFYAPCVMKERD